MQPILQVASADISSLRARETGRLPSDGSGPPLMRIAGKSQGFCDVWMSNQSPCVREVSDVCQLCVGPPTTKPGRKEKRDLLFPGPGAMSPSPIPAGWKLPATLAHPLDSRPLTKKVRVW